MTEFFQRMRICGVCSFLVCCLLLNKKPSCR